MIESDKTSPDKARLRLWIRMLRTTKLVEKQLRQNLRTEFGTTLPKFDVMAALHRAGKGMTMTELSKYLLVSSGNTTGLVDRMVAEGTVVRVHSVTDRRTNYVRLTEEGYARFAKMALQHEKWINALFGDMEDDDIEQFTALHSLPLGQIND